MEKIREPVLHWLHAAYVEFSRGFVGHLLLVVCSGDAGQRCRHPTRSGRTFGASGQHWRYVQRNMMASTYFGGNQGFSCAERASRRLSAG